MTRKWRGGKCEGKEKKEHRENSQKGAHDTSSITTRGFLQCPQFKLPVLLNIPT
jgi:hypothetical protein